MIFKDVFQDGASGVEVFSPSGTNPFKHALLSNEHCVFREYDRAIKGYLIDLTAGDKATNKIHFPKKSGQSLGLTQRFLCFQLFLFENSPFSLEFTFFDTKHCKRRVGFSTAQKGVNVNNLHLLFPLIKVQHDGWVTLIIDTMEVVSVCKDISFSSVESIVISPCCKIRKIFTLPSNWSKNSPVPSAFHFPPDVDTNAVLLPHIAVQSEESELKCSTRTINRVTKKVPAHSLVGRKVNKQITNNNSKHSDQKDPIEIFVDHDAIDREAYLGRVDKMVVEEEKHQIVDVESLQGDNGYIEAQKLYANDESLHDDQEAEKLFIDNGKNFNTNWDKSQSPPLYSLPNHNDDESSPLPQHQLHQLEQPSYPAKYSPKFQTTAIVTVAAYTSPNKANHGYDKNIFVDDESCHEDCDLNNQLEDCPQQEDAVVDTMRESPLDLNADDRFISDYVAPESTDHLEKEILCRLVSECVVLTDNDKSLLELKITKLCKKLENLYNSFN